MNCTMADYLKVVSPYLQSDLVCPNVLLNIHSLAQILPPFSLAFLECRLGSDQPRVDFQVNLSHLSPSLPETLLNHPTWQVFQKIYEEWTVSKSFLYEKVRNIWLEFDVDGQPSQVPIPCIFLTLNPETISKYQEVSEMASKLLNHPVSSQIQSNIKLSMDCLPSKSYISHVGAMLSRSDQTVRINVNEIPPDQVLDYLAEIGWTDPTNILRSDILNLSKFVDDICLSFDVGENILPRIGLECCLGKQPNHEPRWQIFLDYLIGKELCTPDKRNALFTWPGFCQKASNPGNWPYNLTWGDTVLESNSFSILTRKINHIKLVYQPSKILEVKAYLSFSHKWFNTNDLNAK